MRVNLATKLLELNPNATQLVVVANINNLKQQKWT